MTRWEYATAPLIVHATQQILNNWGEDGWELVQIVPGPNPQNLVAQRDWLKVVLTEDFHLFVAEAAFGSNEQPDMIKIFRLLLF